jgi:hypothetical protein
MTTITHDSNSLPELITDFPCPQKNVEKSRVKHICSSTGKREVTLLKVNHKIWAYHCIPESKRVS